MAKRKFGEKSVALYRAQKFEVKFSKEEFTQIFAVSEILRELFNSALAERLGKFTTFITPFYERLKIATEENLSAIKLELRDAYKEHSVTLYDQINALTSRRASDEAFAGVTRNFQEETLDMLDGAFKSFITLRKNGDMDARPPRSRDEGFFQKIPGRYGFKLLGDKFTISLGSGRKISFLVPEYQKERLAEAMKLKKFELYRDEQNLSKPGRFWISIAYELPRLETTEFDPERAVYLALGASSIGISSPNGNSIISLWRSDKFWMPKIESVETRMKERVKGSNGWKRLNQARRRMYELSSRQRKQDEREVVDYLFAKHGNHFVVTELVVRSKEGKLADSEKPERGGRLGLNWAAQNTGSLSRLVLHLEEKARQYRGSVRKHKLILDTAPPSKGVEAKSWIARKLKKSFLDSQEVFV